MAEEKKPFTGKQAIVILLAMIGLAVVVILLTNTIGEIPKQKATNNDIDGYWDSTYTTYSYVFIPKCNIDGLEFTFSIRDKNNNELQQIVKKVGDVQKGKQYTVTFNLTEINLSTIMDANQSKLTITGGQKKLL